MSSRLLIGLLLCGVAVFPAGAEEAEEKMTFDFAACSKRRFEAPPTRPKELMSLRAFPADLLDQTFACGAGQCALACWAWKLNDPLDKFETSRFTFILTLPKGWSLVESVRTTMGSVVAKKLKDGSTEYRMGYAGAPPTASFDLWSPFGILLKADVDAPPGEMTFYVEYAVPYKAEEEVSLEEAPTVVHLTNTTRTRLFTIPPVKVARPKRYANGFWVGGRYAAFQTKEGREGFARMFTDAGATWVAQMRPDVETLAVWRSMGVTHVTPEWYYCADGYRIGDWEKKPDEDKFVYVPSRYYQKELSRGTCPVTVYNESKFFREHTVPELKAFLKGCDGLWGNWEPYMYVNEGCLCDRCRSAFAKYVGVSDEEMAKDWPKEIKKGGKWVDKIVRFRSLEHAKLIRTIHRYVCEFTGGEKSLGFMPGVTWGLMSSRWNIHNLYAAAHPIDYAGDLRWINPWGPYPGWIASKPFKPGSGALCYFVAAKDVRETVDKTYGKKAPRLMALLQGVQGTDWIAQPESISFGLDAFFFNRWQSAIPYHFPVGYDARYWRAFAEATAHAAKYEDIVWDGIRCDEKVVLTLDPSKPYCGLKNGMYPKYLVKHDGISYLQHAAYEKDGLTIVAVFNAPEDLTAHFALKVPHLPAGEYTFDERKVTAAELAAGIPAQVGPSRCRVFEIRRMNPSSN